MEPIYILQDIRALFGDSVKNDDLPRLVGGLLKEVEQLRSERIAIQNDERVITCVFCGHEYPPGTPASNHEALAAHVAVCEKHPAAVFRKERDELKTEVDIFHKHKQELQIYLERVGNTDIDDDALVLDLLEAQTTLKERAEQEVARLKAGRFTPEEFHNLCHETDKPLSRHEFCDGCEAYQIKLFGESPITEMKALLSERRTVHQWLNETGAPTQEEGKEICLLRRLRILCDQMVHNQRLLTDTEAGYRVLLEERNQFLAFVTELAKPNIPSAVGPVQMARIMLERMKKELDMLSGSLRHSHEQAEAILGREVTCGTIALMTEIKFLRLLALKTLNELTFQVPDRANSALPELEDTFKRMGLFKK